MGPSLKKRFFARLLPLACGCLEWVGGKDARGYGAMGIGHARVVKTHRLAWELANGPIPEGMSVLHRCDRPACCNPDHLFLGTQGDNVADMIAKGRHARGDRNGQSKLSAGDVLAIRNDGRTLRELSEIYGVSQSTLSSIRSRKHWIHI